VTQSPPTRTAAAAAALLATHPFTAPADYVPRPDDAFVFTLVFPEPDTTAPLPNARIKLLLLRPNRCLHRGPLQYPAWSVKRMLRDVHPEYRSYGAIPVPLTRRMVSEFVWGRYRAIEAHVRPMTWRVTVAEFEVWYAFELLTAQPPA
jgi:hypothetical protein